MCKVNEESHQRRNKKRGEKLNENLKYMDRGKRKSINMIRNPDNLITQVTDMVSG